MHHSLDIEDFAAHTVNYVVVSSRLISIATPGKRMPPLFSSLASDLVSHRHWSDPVRVTAAMFGCFSKKPSRHVWHEILGLIS